jgi:hypothetical protein
MATDYDSPWKEALDVYFEPFMALLFPRIHARIDWSRRHESLDKEFQQLVPDAGTGRRYVDKLMKVWSKDDAEVWVLIHGEVQAAPDKKFPRRMYDYHTLVGHKYNHPVVSLAVLADDDPDWRPDHYEEEVWGCRRGLWFPTAKLLDFAPHEAMLETSANPFAVVVLAHLKAMQTRGNPADRHAWKIRLVRGLYERGFDAEGVRQLFRFIDWLMELPPALKRVFWREVTHIQEERRMPFISTPEWAGIRKGLLKGIEVALRTRFGEEGAGLLGQIQEILEPEQLEAVLQAVMTATSLDDVRRACASREMTEGA